MEACSEDNGKELQKTRIEKMKVAIICFTVQGAKTATRIREALENRNALSDRKSSENGEFQKTKETLEDRKTSVRVWCAKSDFMPSPASDKNIGHGPSREHSPDDEVELGHVSSREHNPGDEIELGHVSSRERGSGDGLEPLQESLRQWTEDAFAGCDALVYVGATGIAVRSIAPFLRSKTSDPAVLCVDELGKFVIPLVSGHIGGANALAAQLADELGAVAVITTATDLNGRFAVDVFARKNRLWISDMKLAKLISADVLDGQRIGFVSDFPVAGEAPKELEVAEAPKLPKEPETAEALENNIPARGVRECRRGICVTLDETKHPYEQTLTLVPRIVSVGVGCKKGTDPSAIERKIYAALCSCGLSIHSVERLASIDLKAREPGLCAFARKHGIEFVTYTAQELLDAPGEFSESLFVESVTGVSNVCERSAVLASGSGKPTKHSDIQTGEHSAMLASGGKLIQRKIAEDGVTVALAVRDWGAKFE